MTNIEILTRDINGLLDDNRLDYLEMASGELSGDEIAARRQGIVNRVEQLRVLIEHRDLLTGSKA